MMLTYIGIEQNLYASTLTTAMAGGIKQTSILTVVIQKPGSPWTAMMEFKASLVYWGRQLQDRDSIFF